MPKKPKKMLTVKACAAEIGYEEKALRMLIDRRAVPYYKVGRNVRLDPDAVLESLSENYVPPVKG